VGHLVSDADEGEDKLEKGAKREGKTAWDIAQYYSDYFIKALTRLNFTQPDYLPKATEHIAEQIELVKKLEEKGYTYEISDGIYYDTAKFPTYSDFAQLDLDEQQAGARVEYNPEKRNPNDFALWKFSPTDHQRDMEWDSPWGKGFPGWHLECSAMAMRYLGETLDIHSGGIDHVPVHHTNEVAQSEAVTGKPFANYWMHTNHILINDEKIAKSIGNGITLEDVAVKGYSLEALRLHVLESHYRSQSRFSWETLEAAQNRLSNLHAMAALRWQALETTADTVTFALGDVAEELKAFLSDDLNTPAALAYLSSVEAQLNTVLIEKDMVDHFVAMLTAIDEMLGLSLSKIADISNEHKQLIAEREEARARQEWAKSDELRDKLAQANIGVRDTPAGPIWFPM